MWAGPRTVDPLQSKGCRPAGPDGGNSPQQNSLKVEAVVPAGTLACWPGAVPVLCPPQPRPLPAPVPSLGHAPSWSLDPRAFPCPPEGRLQFFTSVHSSSPLQASPRLCHQLPGTRLPCPSLRLSPGCPLAPTWLSLSLPGASAGPLLPLPSQIPPASSQSLLFTPCSPEVTPFPTCPVC